MIQANQLVKFGRKTKIMDIVDNLSVNDFYNVTGYKSSRLHGKMSRLKVSIVDVSKGKKEKANVGEFNLTAQEFKFMYSSITRGIEYITKNPVVMHKANPYKLIDGFIQVREFKLTYESNMKSSSKWKFSIVTGKARPNPDSDFGYSKETYVETAKVFFLLDSNEIREFSYINQFIQLWEQYHFGEFILNRESFKNRLKENNYSEEDLKWNDNKNNQTFQNTGTIKMSNSQKVNANIQNNSNTSKVNTVQNNSNNPRINTNIQKNNSSKPNVKTENFNCERCKTPIDKELFDRTKMIVGIGVCSRCLSNELSK